MFTSSTARRINKSLLVLLALTSLCLSAIAQQTTRNPQASPGKPAVVPVADGAGTQKLPLRRIVLYKSGVGYFEHAGTVRGNAGVEIDFAPGALLGMAKVRQVSEHVNLILQYIPYIQTNFVLGLDTDKGPDPFELTKRFLDMTPAAFRPIRCSPHSAGPRRSTWITSDPTVCCPSHFTSSTITAP